MKCKSNTIPYRIKYLKHMKTRIKKQTMKQENDNYIFPYWIHNLTECHQTLSPYCPVNCLLEAVSVTATSKHVSRLQTVSWIWTIACFHELNCINQCEGYISQVSVFSHPGFLDSCMAKMLLVHNPFTVSL